MALLIDYLEEMSSKLREEEAKLQRLNAQYKKFYDKELRQEITDLKNDMRKTKKELKDELYLNAKELGLIKKHFPDFFGVLLEEEQIGGTIGRVAWLCGIEALGKSAAEKKLDAVRGERKKLREARSFLSKWVGKIDAKSITATWPELKGEISGSIDRDEALLSIANKDRGLRREGWRVILGSELINKQLKRIFKGLIAARGETSDKERALKSAKGKGTVAEYNAKKELDEAKKAQARIERVCTQMLLANPEFLANFKKQKPALGDRTFTESVLEFAEKIKMKDVDEKRWLVGMKKKLS
jgi:hypothetical protein